jgi:Ni/Fe-hydrogenase subunit HybB-like protein
MSLQPRPLGGRLITLPVVVLAVLTAIGFFYIGQRLYLGIGAVANVNPGYPWGIWISIDVMVGTAFGCGGWAMAFLTYALNQGKYHPIVRPALLGGLFGYSFAGMAVMVDLGRYFNAFNLFLPWYVNLNSVMLETALCVMLYIVVVWIEFSPAFLERFRMHGVGLALNKFMFVIIALGMLLPTLHQSSLGSILIVNEAKLSHLWWTEWLPLLYVSSALAMGYGVVAFEATLVSRGFRLKSELPLLVSILRVAFWIIALFLVVRIGAILVAGEIGLAFEANYEALLFWIETVLFVAAMILMSGRQSERSVFLAACALLTAGTLYRIDSYLLAYQGTPGWNYMPSFSEVMITVGLISFEVLLYILFVKFLPVLSNPAVPAQQRRSLVSMMFGLLAGVGGYEPSTVKSGRGR